MPANTAIEILRAAVTRASEYATRGVSLTADGVTFLDAFGERREAVAGGKPVKIDVAAVREALSSNDLRVWNNWRAPENEREFKGQGNWIVVSEDENGVTLKPKKAKAPCLEAVFSPSDKGIARLRSLYLRGGVDVVVLCEGESRVRDVALAFAAERNMLGLPTSLTLAPDSGVHSWDRSLDQSLLQFGPKVFDPAPAAAGEKWEIVQFDDSAGNRTKATEILLSDEDDFEGSRVFVSLSGRYRNWSGAAVQKRLDERTRPAILVDVSLEKSSPVARVMMSSSLVAASTAEETFPDAPWKRFADRKEARRASRPPVPKTWHSTTEAVAEAFIAREAPRGYVSGKSIYFHGPVAFSAYDGNPVAALVDLPGNRTAIFYGREHGLGGTLAGTVTSAQGDVQAAARGKGFLEFHVDGLDEFLSWGGMDLKDVARRCRREKNEESFPSGCKVDKRKLKAFFSRKLEECQAEIEDSHKTGFATYRKAGAYMGMARLGGLRGQLAELFGVSLPEVGDVEGYRANAEEAREAADARHAELRRRAAESREVSEPEEGFAPRP